MIYFLQADNGDMKIGRTENLKQRHSALNTSWRGKLRLIATADCGGEWEDIAHALLGAFLINARGPNHEWFRVDVDGFAWSSLIPKIPGFQMHENAKQARMMRLLHIRICARCGRAIKEGECTGESQLYSPRRAFILCEPCWLKEDAEVEEAGTNNLPDLLATYSLTD